MFGLCRKIPDDTARLKCFDTIVPAPQETDQPKAAQEWSIEDSKSPVDNSPEVFATLTSEDGRSELIIRCKERKIELAVLPSGLFALESGTVLLQINDGPAVTAEQQQGLVRVKRHRPDPAPAGRRKTFREGNRL